MIRIVVRKIPWYSTRDTGTLIIVKDNGRLEEFANGLKEGEPGGPYIHNYGHGRGSAHIKVECDPADTHVSRQAKRGTILPNIPVKIFVASSSASTNVSLNSLYVCFIIEISDSRNQPLRRRICSHHKSNCDTM